MMNQDLQTYSDVSVEFGVRKLGAIKHLSKVIRRRIELCEGAVVNYHGNTK